MGDKMFIYIRNKKNNSFIKEFLNFCDCLTEAKTLKPIGNKYFRVNINDKNYKKYINHLKLMLALIYVRLLI